jgi:hypothetical protein
MTAFHTMQHNPPPFPFKHCEAATFLTNFLYTSHSLVALLAGCAAVALVLAVTFPTSQRSALLSKQPEKATAAAKSAKAPGSEAAAEQKVMKFLKAASKAESGLEVW